VPNRGVGRPGKYCRRSCRQRAFEQRRHAGDQAWSDARLIVLSERLAAHEDALDRVQEVVDELRLELVDDGGVVDAGQVDAALERIERAAAAEET
jgi:hypothetical protein